MRDQLFSVAKVSVLWVFVGGINLHATEADRRPSIDFEGQIAPLLMARCLNCHNPSQPSGGLDLSRRDSALRGGDSGAALQPGDVASSYLLDRVLSGEMPPEDHGKPLSQEEVKLLENWIAGGAEWPEERILSDLELTTETRAGFDWWSLQPITRPPVPEIESSWIQNPIDVFILRKLREQSLQPSPRADRVSLLRRVTYDVIGLPPTPEEIDSFLADESPQAWERVVDRLLSSPHYGERWGRHWLDVVHYADTHGFERDMKRPHAWRYRDYVIQSLNDDKPYSQFIREQIAGDVFDSQNREAVIATGFLVAGPYDFVGQEETGNPLLRRMARADDLDDVVTTVITSTMGLTVNCARCHNHKFDPISQEDYYGLWAVFAGIKRGNRPVDTAWAEERPKRVAQIERKLREVTAALAALEGRGIDLADIVGGGSGYGDGKRGTGIDPRTGESSSGTVGGLPDVQTNRYVESALEYVDGVFIPQGGDEGSRPVPISSTGLTVEELPKTSGASWDYIQNGPVKSQDTTVIDDIDYQSPEHSMLGLHANKGITFDLSAIRSATGHPEFRFRSILGYGGAAGDYSADVWIYLDEKLKEKHLRVSRNNCGQEIDLPITKSDRFLTLIATDGGNSISHDQIYFGDPRLVPQASKEQLTSKQKQERETLKALGDQLRIELQSLPPVEMVYAAVPGDTPAVHILQRGDPESPAAEVAPRALTAITEFPASLSSQDAPDGERRLALADWIVHPLNPLTKRVIVNRIWHYYFGTGIVATPSDFGFHGDRPSHPELLDWLASEFDAHGQSLKALHRTILLSNTYRQSAQWKEHAAMVDANNRLLWRMNPKRLEAEAVRDSMLAVGGNINLRIGGPGYEDFHYIQRYAPVYEYITADRPELWRRSVYRFTVRSVPEQFMKVLDCPNPSNLTPRRNRTTTALQSLTLWNNAFVLQQATYFAKRLEHEGGDRLDDQIELGYRLAFGRLPDQAEREAAMLLVRQHGLFYFCRALLNANEFVYLD